MLADSKSKPIQFFSNLAAGLCRSYDKHRTNGQRLWISIFTGMKLVDLRWQVGAEWWYLGLLVQARCDNHVGSFEFSLVCAHQVSSFMGSTDVTRIPYLTGNSNRSMYASK